MEVPPHSQDPSLYVDWSDAREFTIGDMGVGECAGEVVTLTQFQFAEAEREEFEAQLALEAREFARADRLAYHAMLKAARALVRKQWLDCPEDPAVVVGEFRKRFYDTELFFDRFAKGKFANFLFDRHERELRPGRAADADSTRQAIEEARLFIEAAHACDQRMPAAV
jgi:sulfite reductase (ferredoxin)